MNPHPIFVHFPVALLTVYAVMELVRFNKIMEKGYWFYAKALFLFFGTLGAFAALLTGDFGEEAVRSGAFNVAVSNFKAVVSTHENFADATTIIFSILSLSYIVLWINRDNLFTTIVQKPSIQKIWPQLSKVSNFFANTAMASVLALVGLVCVTITGGLGGVMVYGPAADPVFGFIYKLLFP